MLSLYHMMVPPEYYGEADQLSPPRMRRRFGRDLDLSVWLTRPCLIIMGFVEEAPSPMPVLINGEPPENNSGLTMVRWIYPLPLEADEIVQDRRP